MAGGSSTEGKKAARKRKNVKSDTNAKSAKDKASNGTTKKAKPESSGGVPWWQVLLGLIVVFAGILISAVVLGFISVDNIKENPVWIQARDMVDQAMGKEPLTAPPDVAKEDQEAPPPVPDKVKETPPPDKPKEDPPQKEVKDTGTPKKEKEASPKAKETPPPKVKETPPLDEVKQPPPSEEEKKVPPKTKEAPPKVKETPPPEKDKEAPPPKAKETPPPKIKDTPPVAEVKETSPPEKAKEVPPKTKETPPKVKENPPPENDKAAPPPKAKETLPPKIKDTPAPAEVKETSPPEKAKEVPPKTKEATPPKMETPSPAKTKETSPPKTKEAPPPEEVTKAPTPEKKVEVPSTEKKEPLPEVKKTPDETKKSVPEKGKEVPPPKSKETPAPKKKENPPPDGAKKVSSPGKEKETDPSKSKTTPDDIKKSEEKVDPSSTKKQATPSETKETPSRETPTTGKGKVAPPPPPPKTDKSQPPKKREAPSPDAATKTPPKDETPPKVSEESKVEPKDDKEKPHTGQKEGSMIDINQEGIPEGAGDPFLNAYDQNIIEEIRAADKLLQEKKTEAGLRKFESLLLGHPASPRVRYGRAQAMDQMAEEQRSNDFLRGAITAYGEVIDGADCPPELKVAAVRRQANRMSFMGKTRSASEKLKSLSEEFPDNIEVVKELGVFLLIMGDDAAAKPYFEKALESSPDSGFAKVHLGFIHKRLGNYEKAIGLLEEGIASNQEGTDEGKYFFNLGDSYVRTGRPEQARRVYEDATRRGLFLSPVQRSLYNVDSLRGQPWWTPKEANYEGAVKILESNWKIIRGEAMALMNKETLLFEPEDESLRETGDWKQFTLFSRGKKHEKSCEKAPKTCQLFESIPESTGCKRGQVKFSVMHPGTHVWPHTGPTNCRLRSHLGLVVPPGTRIRVVNETRTWEEGKVMIFDDSFEHEVWQEAESYRMVLISDLWHPELTERQRKYLTPI